MKKICSLLITIIILLPLLSFAAQNTFQINLGVISDDSVAPSISTGLTATAVSSSEIDLSWTASTDNVAVTGYRIFRDNAIIASSTGTTYSNTGLSASTAYTYTVEAFDSTPNYSGQSASSTATTSEAVVVATTTPSTGGSNGSVGSGGGYQYAHIYDLVINPDYKSAIVSFKTDLATQAKVFWGKTNDYELGSLSELLYNTNHSIKIEGLDEASQYFVKIEVTDSLNRIVSTQSYFITKGAFTTNLPPNVVNFKATPEDKGIFLTWNIPANRGIDTVRIVRSDKFYPKDPNDGALIFEGIGEMFVDRDIEVGKNYFYTIFSKDKKGNYSSGAIAKAGSLNPFEGIKYVTTIDPGIAKLSLQDFDFVQSGKKLAMINDTVAINGNENLTIVLKYEKVPEILKTIAVALADPNDSTKIFPFLLRVNSDKTAYEATIAPLGKSGKYDLSVVILDYKNQGLKKLTGSLQALAFVAEESSRDINWTIVSLVVLLIIFGLIRRRNRKSSSENTNFNEN